jgi:hypothetical protein
MSGLVEGMVQGTWHGLEEIALLEIMPAFLGVSFVTSIHC